MDAIIWDNKTTMCAAGMAKRARRMTEQHTPELPFKVLGPQS